MTQLTLGDAAARSDPWWDFCAAQAIASLARTGREFQAFDLVTECGLAEPDHANRWGVAFHRARQAGVIRPSGAAPSKRPTTAGSLVRVWRGAS